MLTMIWPVDVATVHDVAAGVPSCAPTVADTAETLSPVGVVQVPEALVQYRSRTPLIVVPVVGTVKSKVCVTPVAAGTVLDRDRVRSVKLAALAVGIANVATPISISTPAITGTERIFFKVLTIFVLPIA